MLPIPRLTIFAGTAPFQIAHAEAFAQGLKAHGVIPVTKRVDANSPTKHVACWGWRLGKRLRAHGHEVLVMERGYIGDRFAWSSMGWNGLNGRATFYPRDDPSRFAGNFSPLMRPWKEAGTGRYVLIIGQVPGDASLGGIDLSRWYDESVKLACAAYYLPVVFRPHPQAVKRGIAKTLGGTRTHGATLADALSGAEAVITYNSNAAVESVLAGVPTIAADIGSMAYAMCGHKIGERITPDREQWAARLAWCQWKMDEIKSGEAWAVIMPS